jgi:hypothetical protein
MKIQICFAKARMKFCMDEKIEMPQALMVLSILQVVTLRE